MVYTRSQNSTPSVLSAAKALLSLKNGTAVVTRYTLSSKTPTPEQFWVQWSNWYHAFFAEATDEFPSLPIASRRSEATSRWTTFCAKTLKCEESTVRAWLRTADQRALLSA